MAEGHAAHGLPVQDVVVGGAQRGRVPDDHLLLAVTELGVVVLDLEVLGAQRGDQVHDVVVGGSETGGGVDQAVVDRLEAVGADAGRGPGGRGVNSGSNAADMV